MLSERQEPGSVAHTSPDARRELLSRVLASPIFAKSERLSALLSFVCEMTLQGREKELNEQRIGQAIFGRSRDYDSSIDGIVRTQASRLRSRLELYFNGEGANEPVRIVVPRGNYVPRFEPASARDATVAVTPEAPSSVPRLDQVEAAKKRSEHSKAPLRWFAGPFLPWLLVCLLSIGCVLLAARHQTETTRNQSHPAKHPLWSQIFANDKRTLVVPADSGLVMWQGLMDRNIHLADYLSGEYRTRPAAARTAIESVAANLANRRYTSIVDLDVVEALIHISQSENGGIEVRYARDVRPNDLKQGNVVLIGAAEATPWVELFEANMNFYFSNNRAAQIFSVFNRAPRANEPHRWDSAYSDPQHRVFGVVAYLPNVSGDGNALILEGTSMAGTESAWDFVSDDSQLLPFLKRIRKPNGAIPHFEVVLGNNNMNGSAGKNAILAWRTSN